LLSRALLVGAHCGIASHAVLLGATAGVLSTVLATTLYLCHSELVHKDGVWWQRRKDGELARLTAVPRSLRLWTSCLSP
jgi:hypothetical protein